MRIGTWNLENLFRPGQDSGPTTESAYAAKLDALAAAINALSPDVLAVQEVGDPEALADLAARVGGDWHRATADPDGRGIRVGYLSRLELSDIVQVWEFPPGLGPVQVDDTDTRVTAMGRPALQARVRVGDRQINLVTCHLKSKLLTFPSARFSPRDEGERARFSAFALYRRAAEAVTVRAAVTELLDNPDGGEDPVVVVLGDLNDVPEAATTQILLGPPGSEIGTAGYDQSDRGDGQRLWNLAARIPEADRFSRVYRGRGELIDHILVSQALVGTVANGEVATTGAAPSINDDPASRREEPGSDHRPVLAVFNL